ncbi:MAG: HAMP domain-containing sensor histidine kinase [Eubacteriales bacterium]|jgi:two-component system sensor histidine kinase VanS
MKHSIQKKVAFTFIFTMVIVLVAMGVYEFFFIDDYYAYHKKKILKESWSMVNSSSGGKQGDDGSFDVSEVFERFCSANGLTYSVTDSSLTNIVTNAEDGRMMAGRLFGNVLGMEDDNTEVLEDSGEYHLIKIQDRFSRLTYLELWGMLNNGDYYIVYSPIEEIDDAARISLSFYIYIGIASVVIGTIVIWFLSRKIVEPVRQLTEQSKRMAELDFDAHYNGKSEDEIGELGRNFNTMSDKLKKAVGELKSANAKLEKDIAEKTQTDEMRKEFLANVSHELKTPIALIQGYAEGLKDNVNDDPESRDFYCDVIIDESAKMNNMVRQLLTLNQLENGNDMLEMDRFNLTELIDGVIAKLKVMSENAGVSILFDDSKGFFVWGDEFMIEEVVTNYLTNAIHHCEGEKAIEVTCREDNGIVTTTVFNSGKPIPADAIDHIWEKFYKVDRARTRAYGGNGIGLSIVKAIMDRHQQKCSVRNYDNGVAFSFTLESKSGL